MLPPFMMLDDAPHPDDPLHIGHLIVDCLLPNRRYSPPPDGRCQCLPHIPTLHSGVPWTEQEREAVPFGFWPFLLDYPVMLLRWLVLKKNVSPLHFPFPLPYYPSKSPQI